jgi:hypothetical protein
MIKIFRVALRHNVRFESAFGQFSLKLTFGDGTPLPSHETGILVDLCFEHESTKMPFNCPEFLLGQGFEGYAPSWSKENVEFSSLQNLERYVEKLRFEFVHWQKHCWRNWRSLQRRIRNI